MPEVAIEHLRFLDGDKAQRLSLSVSSCARLCMHTVRGCYVDVRFNVARKYDVAYPYRICTMLQVGSA